MNTAGTLQVSASSIYVAEQSTAAKSTFAYSIRMSLLPEEQQRDHWPATLGPFRPLSSCQLKARHWVMRDTAGEVVDEVRGAPKISLLS